MFLYPEWQANKASKVALVNTAVELSNGAKAGKIVVLDDKGNKKEVEVQRLYYMEKSGMKG